MQDIIKRIEKIETNVRTQDDIKYNLPVLIYLDSSTGKYQFRDWKGRLNKGTKEEIEKLLEPYTNRIIRGEACVIWDDIT